MPTPERCRARADEAERLAAIVSYERDRVRLRRQADEWRARAAELEQAPASEPPPGPPAGLIDRVRRWLRAAPRR